MNNRNYYYMCYYTLRRVHTEYGRLGLSLWVGVPFVSFVAGPEVKFSQIAHVGPRDILKHDFSFGRVNTE